jgi:hypothetical protein
MAQAGFRIEHRLGVPVPDTVVWEVISDLGRWSEWNPLYVKAEGQLRIGERLTLTQALPDRERDVITPFIVDWVPNAQILWRLSQQGGFIKRLRYLEIDKLSDDGCIFSNGEDWSGFMTRYVKSDLKRAMRAGFEAMGEAVKARSIALWQEQGGAPTSAPA